MARPCCRSRRIAGAVDHTPTETIDRGELDRLLAVEVFRRPAYPPAALWADDRLLDEPAAAETRELRLADLSDADLRELGRAVATGEYERPALWSTWPTWSRRSGTRRRTDLPAGSSAPDAGAVSVSGDQMAGDEGLAAAAKAAELAERAGIRLPVPRRPWRRVWCFLAAGHLWFPSVGACLECGSPKRR